MKRAKKAALADSTEIAKNGGPGSHVFVPDLDKKIDRSSSTKFTVRRVLPQMETKRLLKKLSVIAFWFNETCKNREKQIVVEVMD